MCEATHHGEAATDLAAEIGGLAVGGDLTDPGDVDSVFRSVLDHFGTPLGVGPYESQREAIFTQWQKDIEAVAQHSNVVAKLGGLAMPDNGFGWHKRAAPATSDEIVAATGRYHRKAIELFGPEHLATVAADPEIDVVVSAIVGAAGLRST